MAGYRNLMPALPAPWRGRVAVALTLGGGALLTAPQAWEALSALEA